MFTYNSDPETHKQTSGCGLYYQEEGDTLFFGVWEENNTTKATQLRIYKTAAGEVAPEEIWQIDGDHWVLNLDFDPVHEALVAAVVEHPAAPGGDTDVWRIPTDGSEANLLATIPQGYGHVVVERPSSY